MADRVGQLELEIADLGVPRVASPPRPFSTSVTNLVALAECPLKFKWIHYDKLPRRPTAAAVHGTQFHRKVELHNLGVIALDDASAGAYDAVEGVDSAGLDADTAADRTQPPHADPWTVFKDSRFAATMARFAEVPFEVAAGSGSVRGKIDAIYEDDEGAWEIVDYKSGRPNTTDARRVQLEAYAVAADEGAFSSTNANTHPRFIRLLWGRRTHRSDRGCGRRMARSCQEQHLVPCRKGGRRSVGCNTIARVQPLRFPGPLRTGKDLAGS